MVGRQAAVDQVAGHARVAADGRAQVVLVEAPPGMGKTLLVDTVTAGLTGWSVHWLALDLSDAETPMTLISRLLEELGAGPNRPPTTYAAAEALLQCCDVIDRPTCVVIDDLHWIDTESAEALWSVARRLNRHPVLWLLTARPSENDLVRRVTKMVDAPRLGCSVVLGPLDVEAVRRYASTVLGQPVSVSTAGQLRKATGGYPLHLRAVVDRLAAAPGGTRSLSMALRKFTDGPGDEADRAFVYSVRNAYATASSSAQVVLDLLAVADGPLSPQELTAAAESLGTGEPAWNEVHHTGLLASPRADGHLAVAHDRVGAVIAAALPPDRRGAIHRALAGIFTGVRSVRHRMGAAEGADADLESELLGYAFERALNRDLERAFRYAEWSSRVADPERRDPNLPEGVILAARLAVVLNRLDFMTELEQRMDSRPPSLTRTGFLAYLAVARGDLATGRSLLQPLRRSELPDDLDGLLLVGHAASALGRYLCAAAAFDRLDVVCDVGRRTMARARPLAEALGPEFGFVTEVESLEAVIGVWAAMQHGDWRQDRISVRQLDAIARRLEGLDGVEVAMAAVISVRGSLHHQAGRITQGYRDITTSTLGLESSRELFVNNLTHLSLMQFVDGEWDDADRSINEALSVSMDNLDDVGSLINCAAGALVPFCRGETSAAEALLAHCDAARPSQNSPILLSHTRLARGWGCFMAGDDQGCIRALDPVDASSSGWGHLGAPMMVPLAISLAGAGRLAGIDRLLGILNDGSPPWAPPLRVMMSEFFRGLVAAAGGGPAGGRAAIDHFVKALGERGPERPLVSATDPEADEVVGLRLVTGMIALELARQVQHHPDLLAKVGAVLHPRLDAAVGVFTRCGAERLRREAVEAVAALMPLAPARTGTYDLDAARLSKAQDRAFGALRQLTSREREIALQVARGHSNREIADELFVSIRTVEYHVHNTLTKLGLGSRVELRRLIRPAGSGAGQSSAITA